MLPYLAGSAAKREMQREFRGLNRRAGDADALQALLAEGRKQKEAIDG